MKNNLNYFNNEERNGIFLLISIILLFSIFIFFQKRVLPSETSIAINVHESNFGSVAEVVPQKLISKANILNAPSTKIKTLPLERVHTKRSSKAGSEKFSKAIKKDTIPKKVNKNLNLNSSTFQKPTKQTFKKKKWKPQPIKSFSLNSKDPEEWKQIKGIGDGFSNRIIKYQNWLGGFHSPEQLNEVYGLEDSLVQVILPHLENKNDFRKIRINYAESKELGKHPYIEWKEANIIIKYRKHHFPITKESFMNLIGVSDETKSKVIPYLDFSVESEEVTDKEVNEGKQDTSTKEFSVKSTD